MNNQPPPPPDRYCDIVMKGGITSGVVYPEAIDELARKYIFKNIGGTSAGAIAAAATAAAEYQRRHTGSMDGFDRLATLPMELGAKEPGRIRRWLINISERLGLAGLASWLLQGSDSRLLTLFQPQAGTRRLFSVLVSSLNRESTFGRTAAILWGFVKAYWLAALGSIVLSIMVWRSAGMLAGLLFFLIALVGSIGVWVYRDLTRNVVANDYGICKGMTANEGAPEALTPWLHRLIQEAAGRGIADNPLTFGDIWTAPGFPPQWLVLPPGTTIKSINLEMFTTNLSHGRPYILPSDDGFDQLCFRKEELEKLLPPKVMEWINDRVLPYAPRPGREGRDPSLEKGKGLFKLPRPEDFPVLLAARMSLSFPLLFSAIPLWAIDHDTSPQKQPREFRRCLFSDGGICSNFPMHLFDGLIPLWPTFGILLEAKLPGRPNMVYLPQQYTQGYGERWNRFDDEAKRLPSRFGGFLGAIVNAMQNWNDTALSRMPGIRDRVVRVRLSEEEGGLNLNMKEDLIRDVAKRGREAASELATRFAPAAGGASTAGWDEQRWIRVNVFLRMLQKQLPGVATACRPGLSHAQDFAAIFRAATVNPPAGHEAGLTAGQLAALQKFMQLLEKFADDFGGVAGYSFAPIPEPELRVRPPL